MMQDWGGILSRDSCREYKDRSVVIAGGAGGMGAALVDGFHWLGAKVIILDKNEYHAAALADHLATRSSDDGFSLHRPVAIAADLTNEKDRARTVADSIDKSGLPCTFISTLGYDKRIGLNDHTQDDLELLLRINFIAPIMLARDYIPLIRKQGGGTICLFTSHHGSDLIDTDMMAYGSAKAALDNGIKRLARYAGENNTPENIVRVFGLRPGWVQTPNQISRFEKNDFETERLQQLVPTPMVAEDIVPFVVANTSHQYARLLSGTILDYDAGSGQICRSQI